MQNRRVTLILLLAIGIFAFLATRNIVNAVKERRADICRSHLADIEGAKEQYAIEHDGEFVDSADALVPQYLDSVPVCPSGGTYTLGDLQTLVTCDVEGHELGW